MSKQYGLIVPNKKSGPVSRPKIFDSDSDSDPAPLKPTSLKRLKPQDKQTQERAVEEDPTVFQYDELYDEMDRKRKETLQSRNHDRQPKYITKLLAAADRRKRENERRIERQVQKEREDEGDEFKDKEAFVTSAYKKKLEEMKEMEEQEKREEYLEEIGNVKKQGNLDGFYRHLYDQKVNYDDGLHTSNVDASDDSSKVPKHKKRTYRTREESNDDEPVADVKDEHLQSNLDADSDFSIDSSDEDKEVVAAEPKVETAEEPPQIKQEEEESKPPPEVTPEPAKPKIDIWMKRTVGSAFTSALLRYNDRKQAHSLTIF